MTTTPPLEASEKFYAEGATAPRITLEYMESQIATVYYMNGSQFADSAEHTDHFSKQRAHPTLLMSTTICLMVLKSGFMVIGQATPISPANADWARGCAIAYENAIRQLWPLFGFAAKNAPLGLPDVVPTILPEPAAPSPAQAAKLPTQP